MGKYLFYTTKDIGYKPIPYSVFDNEGMDLFKQRNRHTDAYYTPNTFKEPTSNTKDNIAELTHIVIDVDNHLQGITSNDAKHYLALLEPYFNVSIPTPSKVVYSGRGLHFYIELEPCTNLAKYDLVSAGIFRLYDIALGEIAPLSNASLRADKQAIGAWRYIRLAGTYNTKAHSYADQIKSYKAKYDLDMLIEGFLEPLQDVKGNMDALQSMHIKATWTPFKQYRKEFTAKTWLYSAIEDLKTIQRNREQEVWRTQSGAYKIGNESFRNKMLFMYGLLCKWAFNDSQAVLDSMQAFNTYYAHGMLSDQEVKATYHSIINKPYKPYKTTKVIELLELTRDEIQALKVLIDKQEVKRRTAKRVKLYKQNKAQQRTLVKTDIKQRALDLRASGRSYRDIAKALNISLGYAHKLTK